MNFSFNTKIILLRSRFFALVFLEVEIKGLVLLWLLILLWSFKRLNNHFISLLITLEIFSLLGLFIASMLRQLNNSLRFLFILMSLRVGEGVLGLALLVKFVRENNSEFVNTSLL